MKTYIKFMAATAAVALALTSQTAMAANSADASASASIVSAMTLTKSSDLKFGNIIASGSAGTVVIGAGADTAAYNNGASAAVTAGTIARAKFDVTGGAGSATTTLSLSASQITLTSGANSMTVDLVKTADQALSSGAATYYVGGTLNVGANQAVGNYTGTFTATVQYN